MQGPVFQVLALVTHSNAALSGRAVKGFYPGHKAFRFTEYVRFVDMGPSGEQLFAADPDEWLGKLRDRDCAGMRAAWRSSDGKTLSDHLSVAFAGGGGCWLVETVSPSGSDFWTPRWEIGNQNHPEQKIWQVTYGQVPQAAEPAVPEPAAIDRLSQELEETLREAAAFARAHRQEWFAADFEAARSALKADVEPDLRGIALPGQLPRSASRLIAAAHAAWVFGGMGSWNDLAYHGEEGAEYDRISQGLFRLLNSGLAAAVSASFGRSGRADGS